MWFNTAVVSEVSVAVQDYAKAIYSIGGEVSNSAIAERLGVSPASASAMVKRLESLGLVIHRPYRGVTLTDAGERVALEVIRHHRLIELYLAQALGNPKRDPHGDPIPTSEGQIEERPTRSLAELEPGEVGTLVRVSDSDPAMLRYLSQRGITPGDRFEVTDKQPFDGPLSVRFGDEEHVFGGALAGAMRTETGG